MKKRLVAAMFAVMMISLVGCGKASEPMPIEATEVVEEVTEEATETKEATEVEAQDEVADDDVAEKPVVDEAPVAEEPASPYSYTELSQTMYAQSTVNVRDLPEQSGGKLGSLSTNQEVTVTGQCNETGWYKISYNGGEGFVSDSYLGSEKVAVKSQSTSKSSGASQSTSQAESQPAQEAPAAETTDDNPYAGMTVEEASDSISITPDVVYCWYCDATFSTKDEMVAHTREVHGVEFPY